MTEQEQIFAYKELRNNGQAFFIDNYEDADRIIEALEKQIPKEPKQISVRNYGVTFYCPVCVNVDIGCDCYCHVCGQKIDWSDKDDKKD